MSQRAVNWIIASGAVIMVLGLSVLPAALGEHDPSILAVASCLFSLGSLSAAGGTYLKARVQQGHGGGNGMPRESAPAARKHKGNCDGCQADIPVIQCTVHRVHLCADCLGSHYDFRSCAYVPTTRRAPTRSGKSTAMRAGRP